MSNNEQSKIITHGPDGNGLLSERGEVGCMLDTPARLDVRSQTGAYPLGVPRDLPAGFENWYALPAPLPRRRRCRSAARKIRDRGLASVSNFAGSGAAAAAARERQDLMRIVKWTGSRKQRRGSGAGAGNERCTPVER
ncbi:hypothetical protein ACJJTC_014434 [Scirpophaga incertulas]